LAYTQGRHSFQKLHANEEIIFTMRKQCKSWWWPVVGLCTLWCLTSCGKGSPIVLSPFVEGEKSNHYKLFHGAPVPTKFPVVLAVVAPDFDVKDPRKVTTLPHDLVFEWKFSPTPGAPAISAPCTINGTTGVQPCRFKVIEYTWNAPGSYLVECSVIRGAETVALLSDTVQVGINGNNEYKSPRHEFRDLPLSDWHRWVNVTIGLKNIGVWDHLTHIHAKTFTKFTDFPFYANRSAAHASPGFLVWHRAFLRIVENLYQKYLLDYGFGIPYCMLQHFSLSVKEVNRRRRHGITMLN
jgi:hypothetical protein